MRLENQRPAPAKPLLPEHRHAHILTGWPWLLLPHGAGKQRHQKLAENGLCTADPSQEAPSDPWPGWMPLSRHQAGHSTCPSHPVTLTHASSSLCPPSHFHPSPVSVIRVHLPHVGSQWDTQLLCLHMSGQKGHLTFLCPPRCHRL